MMPAMFEAKFWMPPIEATCRELGATSPGSDQIPVAAIARLAYEIARNSSATYTEEAGAANTIAAPPSSPPTITVLRTRVTSAPRRITRSATRPAIQAPTIAVIPGSVPSVPELGQVESARVLQVRREPGQEEVDDEVQAEEAEHHAAHGPVAEQVPPAHLAAASSSFSSSRAPFVAMYSRSSAFACLCSIGSR